MDFVRKAFKALSKAFRRIFKSIRVGLWGEEESFQRNLDRPPKAKRKRMQNVFERTGKMHLKGLANGIRKGLQNVFGRAGKMHYKGLANGIWKGWQTVLEVLFNENRRT